MWSELFAFAAGVFLAPAIRPLLRPVAVEAIKAVMLAADEAKRLSEDVKEDLEDAAAEAKAAHAQRRAETQPPPPAAPAAPPPPDAGSTPA
jgi:hypothetical protein